MFQSLFASSLAAALALFMTLPTANAQDQPNKPGADVDISTPGAKINVDVNAKDPDANDKSRDRLGDADEVTPRQAIRASQLIGMNVYSATDRETSLGEINDLVLDARTGKIGYVALSYGGVLGIGDKLFAIPWRSFKTAVNDDNEVMLLLNVDQKKFENAPGFNQDAWPDFSDSEFTNTVDKYYGTQRRDRVNPNPTTNNQ